MEYDNQKRLFLNGMKLLLDNNNWEDVDEKRLKCFIYEVERLKDGDLDWDKLELFSKQMKRLKFNILKDIKSKKK
jgi:hypothetical protein